MQSIYITLTLLIQASIGYSRKAFQTKIVNIFKEIPVKAFLFHRLSTSSEPTTDVWAIPARRSTTSCGSARRWIDRRTSRRTSRRRSATASTVAATPPAKSSPEIWSTSWKRASTTHSGPCRVIHRWNKYPNYNNPT